MMERTQISLSAEDLSRAKARAADLGISLAEYVRRLVARDLSGLGQAADVSVIFGIGASGGSDVSRLKDDYVGQALEQAYEEETRPRR